MSSICSLDSERSSSSFSMSSDSDNKMSTSPSSKSSSPISSILLSMPRPKRTRQRLDHLTPNEKLQRRKMKNRIAAQTARDKRRTIMEILERQNDELKKKNKSLEMENELLRQQLIQQQVMLQKERVILPLEPAELISAPQQKEQGMMNMRMRNPNLNNPPALKQRRVAPHNQKLLTPGWNRVLSMLVSMSLRVLFCSQNAKTRCCPHFCQSIENSLQQQFVKPSQNSNIDHEKNNDLNNPFNYSQFMVVTSDVQSKTNKQNPLEFSSCTISDVMESQNFMLKLLKSQIPLQFTKSRRRLTQQRLRLLKLSRPRS